MSEGEELHQCPDCGVYGPATIETLFSVIYKCCGYEELSKEANIDEDDVRNPGEIASMLKEVQERPVVRGSMESHHDSLRNDGKLDALRWVLGMADDI